MSAYSAAVLADSPVNYWRCNDSGGQVLHDLGSQAVDLFQSGGSQNLGYNGPVSDGGSAYVFGSYFSSALSNYVLAPPYTLEAWIYITKTLTTMVFADCGLQVEVDSSQHALGATPGSALSSSTTITAQAWHQIAMECHSGGRTLYLDGASVALDNVTATSSTQGKFVGNNHLANAGMSGFISEVSFYTTALSATRIAAHHTAADNTSAVPTFLAPTAIDPLTGDLVSLGNLLATVAKYVSNTYKNSP